MLAIASGEGRARLGHLEAAVHRPHELLETSQASTGSSGESELLWNAFGCL